MEIRKFVTLLPLLTYWSVLAVSSEDSKQMSSLPCETILTSVRMEITSSMMHKICQDNNSTSLIIQSGDVVSSWKIKGFCSSYDVNIGEAVMDQLLPSPSVLLKIVKSGQVVESALVDILTSDQLFHYQISVWGVQNTRFIVVISKECVASADHDSATSGNDVHQNNIDISSQKPSLIHSSLNDEEYSSTVLPLGKVSEFVQNEIENKPSDFHDSSEIVSKQNNIKFKFLKPLTEFSSTSDESGFENNSADDESSEKHPTGIIKRSFENDEKKTEKDNSEFSISDSEKESGIVNVFLESPSHAAAPSTSTQTVLLQLLNPSSVIIEEHIVSANFHNSPELSLTSQNVFENQPSNGVYRQYDSNINNLHTMTKIVDNDAMRRDAFLAPSSTATLSATSLERKLETQRLSGESPDGNVKDTTDVLQLFLPTLGTSPTVSQSDIQTTTNNWIVPQMTSSMFDILLKNTNEALIAPTTTLSFFRTNLVGLPVEFSKYTQVTFSPALKNLQTLNLVNVSLSSSKSYDNFEQTKEDDVSYVLASLLPPTPLDLMSSSAISSSAFSIDNFKEPTLNSQPTMSTYRDGLFKQTNYIQVSSTIDYRSTTLTTLNVATSYKDNDNLQLPSNVLFSSFSPSEFSTPLNNVLSTDSLQNTLLSSTLPLEQSLDSNVPTEASSSLTTTTNSFLIENSQTSTAMTADNVHLSSTSDTLFITAIISSVEPEQTETFLSSNSPATTQFSRSPGTPEPSKGLEDDAFWPIVAGLVIGIPALIVLGIAITVIHRKSRRDPSKFFIMRTLNSTSLSSLATLRQEILQRTSVDV